ncbi:ABC transporter substrate-binding protein [Myceligenerans pegani]|uniref:ABC transporter substrate-binding protein n=1 Tax=Myceligenerans pegani TaxID=2776917 RepID=A0ABR9N592_9MICO|nr:ABC transporter substrate-binding protein [Myceligenerans sp. TRM 65318]MBE1878289.1 ABC transporter substrate-binding protein [Myceligenerans sp. TRM 65318]MBE3020560.1 ABC transporter substrate-binding protein [Myceligenerans sp. TRM 65318]
MSSLSRRRTRRSAAIASVAVAALFLGACSGGSGGAGDDQDGGPAAAELALAVNSPPNSMDPAQLIDGQQMFVWSSVYDTLLSKENGTGELRPNAAESWEYNEDGTELTLELRDGMTFSNGDPVDAEAVAATMRRSMETPGPLQPKFDAVSGVDAVDDGTVLVEFEAYDPEFLPQLALSLGTVGHPGTMDEERTATDPIGSGAYTLDTEQTVPGTSYVLRKRDDYWNADAYPFTTVTVKVLQDPTASFNALQAGEINAATVRGQMVEQLGDSYSMTTIDASAVAVINILDRAGEKWPALGDVRVRQAINHAIDRENIQKSILGGAGVVSNQVFSPYGDVYDESLNRYEYDPAKGKALVEEAGFTGTTFKIPSTYLSTAFEPALSQAFEDIGLGLEWVPVPPQQAQSALSSGEYPLYLQIEGFNSTATSAYTHYSPGGFSNPRGYTDETLDELFDEIESTVDPEQALPAYRELNAYAVDQALQAPFVYTGTTWATADGVTMLDDGTSGVPTVRLFGVRS